MKALLLALALIPSLSFADVSVPRSKQYLWTVFDVAANGGGIGTHNQGAYLPAGAVLTNEWVYINTQFASSGTESLSFGCAAAADIMAANSVKNIQANAAISALLGSVQPGQGGNSAFIGANIVANGGVFQYNGGFGSIPTACQVTATVATTKYTAGKATLIIEYFVK